MRIRTVDIFILFLANSLISQSLSLPQGNAYEAKPGQIITVPVLIENRQTTEKRFTQNIEASPYITSLIAPLPIKIAGSESDVEIISLKISRNTPPGKHKIVYKLKDMDGYSDDQVAEFSINVSENYDLWITTLSGADYVFSEENYSEIFYIENRSNKKVTLSFVISANKDADISWDRQNYLSVILNPGESKEIPFQVQAKGYGKGNYGTEITLSVTGDIKTNYTLRTMVIDKGSKLTNILRTLPLLISNKVEYTKEDSSFTWQPSLFVSGSIDKRNKWKINGQYISHQLEVNAFERFFIEDEIEYFQPDDRFNLMLTTPEMSIKIGDNSKTYSELITRQSLRGIQSDFRIGKFMMEGFYQNPNWLPTQKSFYLGKFGLEMNGHRLKIGSTFSGDDSLKKTFTVDYHKRVSSMIDIDLELASNLEHGLIPSYRYNNGALALNLKGSSQIFNHSTILILSGNNFCKSYQKQNHISTNLLFRPWDRIHLNPAGYYEKLAFTEYAAPERYGGSFSIVTKPFKRTRVSLGTDLDFAQSDMRTDEIGGRVSLDHSFSFAAISGTWEQGILKNDTLHSKYSKATVNLGISAGQILSLSGYARYRTNDLINTSKPDEFIAGVRTHIKPFEFLTLKSSYAVEMSVDDFSKSRIFSDAGIAIKMFNSDHVLDLSARYESSIEGNEEIRFYGTYRIPVGIPVGINRENGNLWGIVTAEAKPVTNAVISLNGTITKSDDKGYFRFVGVEKGKCHLEIDLPETFVDYVPEMSSSLNFALTDKDHEINLNMVKGAIITGSVLLYKPKYEGAIPEKDEEIIFDRAYPGCKVFLKKGDLYRKGKTDEKGRFTFERLEPGNWELIISEGEIPERTEVFGQGKVNLSQGETREIEISIKPEKSKIQMILPEKTLRKEK